MSNETLRGQAQLRDMSPAQGLYDVAYTLHINTRTIRDIGKPATTRQVVTADIQSISGRKLRDGLYRLEEDGKALYRFEKNGTSWHVLS
jgi:hypothetical protein